MAPVVGTIGAASAKGFGWTIGGAQATPMWSFGATSTTSDGFQNETSNVAVLPNGNAVWAMYFRPNYGTNQNYNLYLVCVNSVTGAVVWSKFLQYTRTGVSANLYGINNSFPRVLADASGNIFVVQCMALFSNTTQFGFSICKLDSSGSILSSVGYGFTGSATPMGNYGFGVDLDSSGNIIVASGVQRFDSSQQYAGQVFKVSGSSLSLLWQRAYNNTSSGYQGIYFTAVTVDRTNDNIYVGGFNNAGTNNALIVQFDSSGTVLASKSVSSVTYNTPRIFISGSYLYYLNNNNVYQLNLALSSSTLYSLTNYQVLDGNPSYTAGNALFTLYYSVNGQLRPYVEMTSSGTIATQANYFNAVNQNKTTAPLAISSANWIIPLPVNYSSGAWQPSNAIFNIPVANLAGTSLAEANATTPSTTLTTVPSFTSSSATLTNFSLGSDTTGFYFSNISGVAFSVATAVTGITESFSTYTPANTKTSNSYVYAGTYSWVAPAGVTSVSAVMVGGGGSGTCSSGGGGGGLAYRNNISVTPGSSYTVTVGAGGPATNGPGGASTAFCFTAGGGATSVSGGVPSGSYTGGGNGGRGSGGYGGGGGAGGYTGNGGNGGNSTGNGTAGSGGAGGGGAGYGVYFCCCAGFVYGGGANGGGVGIVVAGTSGVAGVYGSSFPSGGFGSGAAFNARFGGGGGAGGSYSSYGRSGASGAVRIVWPGSTRSFPSTNVKDEQ